MTHGLVIVGYIALTLAATFPVAFRPSSGAMGKPVVDVFCHQWDIWWAWWSLFEGRGSFLFTDYLHYPPGLSTSVFLAGPLLYVVAGALRALLGDLHAAYNAVVLLCMLCSCVGGYVAGLRFLKQPGPAFFVGAVVAFNPLVLHQVQLGIIEFVNLGWAMLFFASVHRMSERRDLRRVLASLGWYVVATTWCWYMGLLLAVLGGLYLLSVTELRKLLTTRRRYLGLLAAWGAGIGAVMLAASLVTSAGAVGVRLQRVEGRLARAMAGQEHDLYADDTLAMRTHARRLGIEPADAAAALEVKLHGSLDPARSLVAWDREDPGAEWFPLRWLAPLLLAVAAFVWVRRRLVFSCGVIIAVGVLLALGPCLVVLDKVQWRSYGWTPYGLLTWLVPPLGRMQFPDRMLLVATMALAVAAGVGYGHLVAKVRRGLPSAVAAACAALLTVAGSLSLVDYPVPQTSQPVPRFYRRLAAMEGDFAVLEVPFAQGSEVTRGQALARHAYYQTVHHKRLHSGPVPSYIVEASRPSEVAGNPLLRTLRRVADGEAAPPELEAERLGLERLRRRGFRYIVLHDPDLGERALKAAMKLLTELLGPPEHDQSADVEDLPDLLFIYRIPPAAAGSGGAR